MLTLLIALFLHAEEAVQTQPAEAPANNNYQSYTYTNPDTANKKDCYKEIKEEILSHIGGESTEADREQYIKNYTEAVKADEPFLKELINEFDMLNK